MNPERVLGWVVAVILIILLVWVVLEVMEDEDPGFINLGQTYEAIAG